jgi:hypothetical protein
VCECSRGECRKGGAGLGLGRGRTGSGILSPVFQIHVSSLLSSVFKLLMTHKVSCKSGKFPGKLAGGGGTSLKSVLQVFFITVHLYEKCRFVFQHRQSRAFLSF